MFQGRFRSQPNLKVIRFGNPAFLLVLLPILLPLLMVVGLLFGVGFLAFLFLPHKKMEWGKFPFGANRPRVDKTGAIEAEFREL